MGANARAHSPPRGPDPQLSPGHQALPNQAPQGHASPVRQRGEPCAVPLKPLAPSALLNSLAAGTRQQAGSKAPNAITVPVSLSPSPPPASSQPHFWRRRRAGREEGNQSLSRAEAVLLQP